MKILLIVLLTLVVSLLAYLQFSNQSVNDVGLWAMKVLKKIKGKEVVLATLHSGESPLVDHAIWDQLLHRFVNDQGLVDYPGFISQKDSLQEYLDTLSHHPPGSNWGEEEKLAYWINAYNAFTVKLIVDHYPVKSIKDISGGSAVLDSPWDIKFFKIGEVDFDLGTIEHEILRQQFTEPRIHFAINCASFSCPALRSEAYTAAHLDKQLEAQARIFINDPRKNHLSEVLLELSKIFDWFQSDFTKKKSLLSYIRQHAAIEISDHAKITYLDYDWSLNSQ